MCYVYMYIHMCDVHTKCLFWLKEFPPAPGRSCLGSLLPGMAPFDIQRALCVNNVVVPATRGGACHSGPLRPLPKHLGLPAREPGALQGARPLDGSDPAELYSEVVGQELHARPSFTRGRPTHSCQEEQEMWRAEVRRCHLAPCRFEGRSCGSRTRRSV